MPSATQSRAVRHPDGATSPCADLCLKAWHANSYSLQRYNISIKIQLPRLFYRIRNRHNAASHHSATTIWPADDMLPSKHNTTHYFNLFLILHLYDLTFHFSQSGEIATEKNVSESHIQTIGKYFTPHTDAEKAILHRKTVHIMARNAPYHAMIQAVSLADTDHFARRRKIHRITLLTQTHDNQPIAYKCAKPLSFTNNAADIFWFQNIKISATLF